MMNYKQSVDLCYVYLLEKSSGASTVLVPHFVSFHINYFRQYLDTVTGIPLPQKGNTRLCPNYRMIGLISHPSKVKLRVILNRQKPGRTDLEREATMFQITEKNN